ncbi:MAG: lactate utilization protein [Planctomycetaceae bacterium]|jgi:L-lactate dehydrogenase complex protein LldG|nr:lactate utilization protein [Planctomycetaceae bacterium]
MSSRNKILGRIRSALNAAPGTEKLPQMPMIWALKNLTTDELRSSYCESLVQAAGEVVLCASQEDAAAKITAFLKELNAKKIGVARRIIVTETLKKSDAFQPDTKEFELLYAPLDNPADISREEMGILDASIVGAEYLLADTGSAVVASPCAFDRILCYIPPVCCVVASASMIREHLPAAWQEISRRIRGEEQSNVHLPIEKHGEFLIVTGPSRTADIEKILVLGVHGPKRLVVFLTE